MYALLYAATNGAFDEVPLPKIEAAKDALLRELKTKHDKLISTLNTGDKPSEADQKTVLKVAETITKTYVDTSKAKSPVGDKE